MAHSLELTQTAPRNLARSTGAICAGLVTVAGLSTATDVLLHATGVFPEYGHAMSSGLFVLASAYRSAFAVLGGYVCARIAARKPVTHALVLGTLGLLASLAGLAATIGRGPEFGPLWYPVLLALTAVPCSWLGAAAFKSA